MYCPGDARSVGSLVNEPVCAVVLFDGSHRSGLASGCSDPSLARVCCSLSRLREEENGFIGGVFLFANAYSFICE